MVDFESQMTAAVPGFEFTDKTIAFGTSGLRWPPNWRKRNTETAEERKQVTELRHWLFHVTTLDPDARGGLRTMGSLLAAFEGAPPMGSGEPPEWKREPSARWLDKHCTPYESLPLHEPVSAAVATTVSRRRMVIPIPTVESLLGRDREVGCGCGVRLTPVAQAPRWAWGGCVGLRCACVRVGLCVLSLERPSWTIRVSGCRSNACL